jgi:hypothetical protein
VTGLLAVCVLCATVIYLSREWKPVVERITAREQPALPKSAEPMPKDLKHLVSQLSTDGSDGDGVMQQQAEAVLYEKYADFDRDWSKVRIWAAANYHVADTWMS